jgi:hypothetical protein
MNIWRMKLRAGKGGDNMWPACQKRGIASFTHGPILNTDLTNLDKSDVDSAVKGSARPSIWWFAWEIKGGDEIYVGDSESHSIIGKGIVGGESGQRAYRYNPGDAMTEPSNPTVAWRHEVPVAWDSSFKPFEYTDPAPQNSVFPFRPAKSKELKGQEEAPDKYEDGANQSLLNELAYQRETPASKKNIERLHVRLSNQFRLWLEENFVVNVTQEKHGIDLTFVCATKKHLAELKICYADDTRHAIREAMGQLLEYNHYPSYEEAQFWWLVLDCEPSKTDLRYISILRKKYGVPLTLAWRSGEDFNTFPSVPLEAR